MKNKILKFKFVLLFIVLGSILFLFNRVEANTKIKIYNIGELTKYVNYRVSNGELNFEFTAFADTNDRNSSELLSGTQCQAIQSGLRNVSEFHAAIINCPYETTQMNSLAEFDYRIISPITSEEYAKVKSFIELESKKMLSTTKDQDKLVTLVINFTRNKDWSSLWNYGTMDVGEVFNLMSSLFFQHLGIEHRVVSGRPNWGGSYHWNLVKVNDVWFHCSYSEDMCFKTDADFNSMFTWNYSLYPKATTKYVRTESVKTATYTEIVKLPDPKIEIIENGYVEEPSVGFEPVSASSWAVEGIKKAYNKGLISGYLQDDYQKPITRAEFTSLIINLYEYATGNVNYNYVPKSPKFVDVNDNLHANMYISSIYRAYDLGIVNGVSETKFAPENLITREQIAVMLVRTIDVIGYKYNVSPSYIVFADDSAISSWAKEPVQTLYKLDVMSGVGNNKINPKGNTTREQAILLTNRIAEIIKK